MIFTKKVPEWKNVGAEPPEDIKKDGFKAGYKPPAAYFNWFFNRISESTKEMQDKLSADDGDKLSADGGDISNTVIQSLDDIITEFPVPVAGERLHLFLGKAVKFLVDTKDWMTGVCMLGQLVNNCVTNRADLPLAAAQGKALMDLYTQLNSDLDAKIGSIQVAELTIASKGAISGQEVRISNEAYTIIANFNVALTVTVPIYCWGKYTVTSGGLITTTIAIDNSKFYYEIEMYDDLIIYKDGNEYNDLTAGWVAAFYSGNPDYTRLATAKADSYLHIYDQDRGYNRYMTVWQTSTSIDLTYCTKIIITCELVLSARVPGHAHLQVLLSPIISNGGGTWPTGTISAGIYSKPTDGNVTLEFDISEITGKYQIMIEGRSFNYSGNGPSNCNCKIKQVQLRN